MPRIGPGPPQFCHARARLRGDTTRGRDPGDPRGLTHSRGRRRQPDRRPDRPQPRGGRVLLHAGGGRRPGPGRVRPPRALPGGARPGARRPRRPRGNAPAAPRERRADRDGHGRHHGERQAARPGGRRRRLRHQAVQHRRAAGAGARAAAALERPAGGAQDRGRRPAHRPQPPLGGARRTLGVAHHARVRPALLPRRAPRAGVQPRGADGAGVGQRPGGGRALDGQPRLAPAPQARRRHARAALPADGVGRGLPPGGPGVTVAVRGRSLVWLVAGAFLLAAVVGAVLQGLAVLAVLRPIEAGEARARAELLVASVAAAYAAAPAPPAGAELDTLLRRQRTLHSIRPAVLMVRRADGTLVTSPPEFVSFAARLLADSLQGSEGRGRSEILARHALVHGGRRLGELLVVRRVPRGPEPETGPVALLLYFPIAALISGALALLLVRLLARRLRALQDLADRVAAGDLSARVADPRG